MNKDEKLVVSIDGVDFVENDTKGNAKKLVDYIFQNEKEAAMSYDRQIIEDLNSIRYEFECKFKALPENSFDVSETIYQALRVVEKHNLLWKGKAGKLFNTNSENWFETAKYFGFFMDMDSKTQTCALNCEAYSRTREDLITLSMDFYKNQNKEIFDNLVNEEIYMELMNYYKNAEDNNDNEEPNM